MWKVRFRVKNPPIGIVKEVAVPFGSIPIGAATLIDLGTSSIYNHMFVLNSTNQDIMVGSVSGGSEWIIPTGIGGMIYDDLLLQGLLQGRYRSVAPTSGELIVQIW